MTHNSPLQKISIPWILIIVSLLSGPMGPAAAAQTDLPFRPGEKLTFVLKWEFVPAGEAVLEVRPIQMINGSEAFHFVMTAKSNSFVDVFYKVRDRIDAYTDLKVTQSVFYKKKQREGSHKRDVIVKFDWGKNQAHYSNFGKENETISLLPGSFDPLSAFYYTRTIDIKPDTQIQRPVTDGKKNVIGRAKILKKERLELEIGTFDTILIEPEIKEIGGVFKESKDAKIQVWVTADHRRIPVRIKSKVVVGSFIGELVSAEGLK